MRLLFYTATVVFVILAGVFAFYALQMPDQAEGAKVVLTIDTQEAPTISTNTLYPEERSAPLVEQQQAAYDERNAQPDAPVYDANPDAVSDVRGEVGADSSSEGAAIGERTDAWDGSHRDNPPEVVQTDAAPAVEESSQDEPGADESLPVLLPGTAISGVDGGVAPAADFKEGFAQTEAQGGGDSANDASSSVIATEEPQPQQEEKLAALPEAVPATESITAEPATKSIAAEPVTESVTAEPATESVAAEPAAQSAASDPQIEPLREEPASSAETAAEAVIAATESGAQEAPASPDERELKKNFDAFLDTLKKKREGEAGAVAQIPPPPVPLRRPGTIPPPVKTAALENWAGSQFATTEIATKKSAAKTAARTATKPTGKPVRIAILLRGVGRDDRNSGDAVSKLPSAISLAVMPLSGGAPHWARKAREAGHEVIVQLPLEPSDYPINNPGPETLLTAAGPEQNLIKMRTLLGRFEGYTGVTNYLGGKILQSSEALRPILEDLKAKGLVYVGEGNNSHAVLRRIAGEIGLRYGGANVVIDAHPTPAAINQALDQLVELARKEGNAIGMAYASRTTIQQLETWSQSVSAKGITLVPVGALAQAPGAS
jgi:polysaccharide deacetylase 2 family uncharacterized protein YibQ